MPHNIVPLCATPMWPHPIWACGPVGGGLIRQQACGGARCVAAAGVPVWRQQACGGNRCGCGGSRCGCGGIRCGCGGARCGCGGIRCVAVAGVPVPLPHKVPHHQACHACVLGQLPCKAGLSSCQIRLVPNQLPLKGASVGW